MSIEYMFDVFPTIRIVGGYIRDALLLKSSKDIDFSLMMTPQEFEFKLTKHNLPIDTIFKDGGVYKVMDYEVTLCRRDIFRNKSTLSFQFGVDYFEDSFRRDFTCNAIYMDKDGKLWDYHNGIQHCLNRQVVWIGDPEERIKECPKRILRYEKYKKEMQVK
jgi:tRNA nucleotidyltransferase/poly(A) polymerase